MRLGNEIPYKEVSGEVGHAPMRALQLNRHLTALSLINMVHNVQRFQNIAYWTLALPGSPIVVG